MPFRSHCSARASCALAPASPTSAYPEVTTTAAWVRQPRPVDRLGDQFLRDHDVSAIDPAGHIRARGIRLEPVHLPPFGFTM